MTAHPLVLLPGMMCDRRQWAPQIGGLSDLCDPIVGDLTQDATVSGMATTVLAQAPPRFALAGLSMGGIVAFEVWRQAPERVSHLALLDTNARPDNPERRRIRMEQIGAVLGGTLRSIVIDELKPAYLANRNRGNQRLLDLIVAMAIDLGPQVFERQSLALKNRPDSRPMLATIDCPTLVLRGEEDALCDEEDHRAIAAGIHRARYLVVPGCGHISTLESPEVVTAALRSLLTAPRPIAARHTSVGALL